MFLLKQYEGQLLEKLVKPIKSSISTFMFIEGGANTLEQRSVKASELLEELRPFLVEMVLDVEIGDHKNIRYFFNFTETSFKLITKYGSTTSAWQFPELFESLSFLRSNGHSVLFIDFSGVARYFVDEFEAIAIKKELSFRSKDVVRFSEFLADPENEREDYYSWITIVNYPE